jgi:outer membrane receptor for ferrienterochelin and colicin
MLTAGVLVSWLSVSPAGTVLAQTVHPAPAPDAPSQGHVTVEPPASTPAPGTTPAPDTLAAPAASIAPDAPAQPGAVPQTPAPASQPAPVRRDASTGALRVIVMDDSGAAIVGTQVHVTSAAGFDRTVEANARGEALFEGLAPGHYNVHAEFPAFEPLDLHDLNVKKGSETKKELTLEIGKFVEQVEVTRDQTDKELHDSFSTGLTKEQIDQLPDDPDEMADQLAAMAGPGASMWVNGFNGGRMPTKDQIASIRFRFDPYSADNHDAGIPRVDIVTRPGNGEWRNNFTSTFRSSSLNGRNALAPVRGDEQSRRGFWTIDGPLQKGKTSFSLSLMGFDAFDSQTIRGQNTTGDNFSQVVQQPNNRVNFDARVEHALTKNHTLRIELQRMSNSARNQGVGQFDLIERAYTLDTDNTVFRISDSGQVFRKARNEIRVQFNATGMQQRSASDALTINIQGAQRSGGAQLAGGTTAHEIEVSDDLDFTVAKKHSMRVGFLLEGGTYRNDTQSNTTGTYTFAGLTQFEAGTPLQFTRRFGDPLITYNNYEFGMYVTDEVKLTKTVMLDYGVRYEAETHLSDYNNFAPRANLTWAPFKNNRTTVRAGFGIFYDWFDTGDYAQTVQLDGQHQFDEIILNPSFPDPSGGAGTILPPSIVTSASNLAMPAVRRFSVGFEHQINAWLRLRTNFFNDHRWNRLRSLNENYPVLGVRPDPLEGNIAEIQSIGYADSKGMDIGLNIMVPQRRMFMFLNYTLGQAENDADGATILPASNTLATEWAPSRNDVRHRLFAMFSTPLPKNFRTNLNIRYQSATPYNITTGFDNNGDGVVNDRPLGVSRNSVRGDGQFTADLRLGWTRAFGPPREPAGPGGRGGGGGPVRVGGPGGGRGGPGGGGGGMDGGPINPDNKRYALELFAQANNVLNTVNYTAYSGVQSGGDFFQQPILAAPPRRIELGMRIQF